FVYRFNRRIHLEPHPIRLFVAAATIGPRPARWLQQAEESC
ncbi:MAG: IS1595 family transposase, partial [Nitrosomonas sp.]|nr:IS1595 family transposase [Nitrosomonas sp.]